MANKKLHIGDYAKIKDRRHGHEFRMGTVVKIIKKTPGSTQDYYAEDLKGKTGWWVQDDELRKVSPIKNTPA